LIAANACRQTGNRPNGPPVSDRGWKRPFDDPIPLPRGRQLVTLQDAATYVTKLPEAEQHHPAWQAAIEALILVAEFGGPTMFARIGVMRALNRNVERAFAWPGKDHHPGDHRSVISWPRDSLSRNHVDNAVDGYAPAIRKRVGVRSWPQTGNRPKAIATRPYPRRNLRRCGGRQYTRAAMWFANGYWTSRSQEPLWSKAPAIAG
jgi:hypothetical protein